MTSSRPSCVCFPVRALVALLVPLLNAADSSGPPLLHAVRTRDTAAWQALLKAKPDVNARDAAGNTALHHAALNRDLAAVTALLAAGADADAKNAAEATPLLYGAGDAGIVRAFLARGADPNATSSLKVTPLMVAVSHPVSHAAATLLIEAGADVQAARSKEEGGTVLPRAVEGGDAATIHLLLSRGAAKDPKAAANALGGAAFVGDTKTIELLLAHGADPNQSDGFAGHALNLAVLGQAPAAARLLIERGADLGMRSPRGHGTPPMVFAGYNQSGDASVAKALVERGVDVNAASDQGTTALSYALRSGPHTPLVEYLLSVGAKHSETKQLKRVPDRPVPVSLAARAELVRERMPATIKLLQLSSDAFLDNGFVQKTGCTSCHGQDLPAMVYGLARERGFAIDDVSLGRQIGMLVSRLEQRSERTRQLIEPLPGSPVSISYALAGLRAARYPKDEISGTLVRYLLRTQQPAGAWIDPIRRSPMEDGTLVATGWVALSVRDYAPSELKQDAADSLARAGRWLAQQKPVTHNDAVFQLLGLHWSNVPLEKRTDLVQRLGATQRPDGGWAQLPGLGSDAWATGSALYALHEAGGMATTDPAYQRGVAYLLRTQFEDGSWWVRTRSWAFQPHFNARFPHGKDQWISQGGTAWASMALLFLLEPVKSAQPAPTAQELMAAFKQSPAAQRRSVDPKSPTNATAARVDFARDIKPLFERSCAGCHGSEKPRGGFALVSRETLIKGGASGEPAIAPGYSDDSTLIQYVTGKIEDLEMPPLNRREKYPALSASEIDTLRAWIDAGAPWPAAETLKPAASGALE